MGGEDYRVGVDFGTSNTAAVLAFPDGRVRPLLFDGSPLLPSAVYADPAGGLLVGRDAAHAARTRPDCFEPYPKRCVDDGAVLLGGTPVPVPELIGAVVRRVAAEAARVAGGPVPRSVFTCPVGWGAARRGLLLAAARAEFDEVSLVTEPVAAATYFVTTAGGRMPVGSCVMVYDLGAGTFDASVVRRVVDGFEVLAAAGLPDAGGIDVDAAIFAALGGTYRERDAAAWTRLAEPADRADQRAARALWDDVRTGKEVLSRAARTTVHVPIFDDDAALGREEVEALARPVLDRTVALCRTVLARASVAPTGLAGLFLVGGSSRMPLAAALLHQHLGVAPTVVEQPELVVAEGSLSARPIPAATTAGDPTGSTSAWPGEPPLPPEPPEPPRRLSYRALAAIGLTVALLAAVLAVVLSQRRDASSDDLARVPEPLRADCRRGAPAVPGATASLLCPGSDGDALVGLFRDRAAVAAAYDEAVRNSGVPRGDGDCAAGGGGEHRYPGAGPARGRVLCYRTGGTTGIVWTDDAAVTLSRLESSTVSYAALRAAWQSWTGSPAFPTADERALIDLIALADCRRAGIADLDDFPGAVAGVRCTPDGVGARDVSYFRFPTLPDLRGAMDGLAAAARAPTGVACEGGRAPGFRGTRRYDLRSAEIGVLTCRPGPQSTLVLEWSVEPLLVAGRATGADADALSAWWRGYSGPSTARIVDAVNRRSSPPFPTGPERALLDRVPARSRVNCLRPSPEQVRRNVGAAPVVVVVCGPTSGARIVFYYRFPAASAMRRSYGSGGAGGRACTTLPDGFTGEAAYRLGRATGRLRCGTNEDGSRYLEWTHDGLAVQAFAFQGGDPAAMIDWWRHDAGPR